MTVHADRHGSTTVVRIDRPERRNSLDADTILGIGTAFTEAELDDAVRSVILTGTGPLAFCAGMDLKAPRGETRDGPGLEVFTTRCYPKPVIAAVNGPAVGGGFELVLASDLVIAAEHATFSVPEVLRGLVGAGCTTRLSARLPPAVVSELVFLGTTIDAHRAQELGLVNQVVPAEDLLSRALEIGEQIERAAPIGLRIAKQLVFREQRMHDAAEWREIRALAAPAFASADAAEGATAFAERRPPVWTGR